MIDPIMLALAKKMGGGSGGSTDTTVETEILPLTTYSYFAMNTTYGVYGVDVEVPYTLIIGETYFVVWDGETYECVAQDSSALSEGGVVLGNCAHWGLLGNGEPFVIATSNRGAALTGSITDTEAGGSHTVRIYRVASSKVPAVSAADNGKFLQVVDGEWTAVAITNAEEVEV